LKVVSDSTSTLISSDNLTKTYAITSLLILQKQLACLNENSIKWKVKSMRSLTQKLHLQELLGDFQQKF